MRSRVSGFRQSDVTKALRGAEKGGMRVARVEIEVGGKIVIHGATGTEQGQPNPWDEELGR